MLLVEERRLVTDSLNALFPPLPGVSVSPKSSKNESASSVTILPPMRGDF